MLRQEKKSFFILLIVSVSLFCLLSALCYVLDIWYLKLVKMFRYCHRYDNGSSSSSSKQQSKWCSKAYRRKVEDSMRCETRERIINIIHYIKQKKLKMTMELDGQVSSTLLVHVVGLNCFNYQFLINAQPTRSLFVSMEKWKLKKPNCNNFMLRTWDVSELSWKEAN